MRPAFLVFTSLGWSSDREHRLAFRPPDPGHAPSLSTASREVRQRASPPAPQSSPGGQLSGQKLPEAARQVHPRRPFVASESFRNGLHLFRPLGGVNLSIRSTRPEAVVIWPLDLSPVRLASLDLRTSIPLRIPSRYAAPQFRDASDACPPVKRAVDLSPRLPPPAIRHGATGRPGAASCQGQSADRSRSRVASRVGCCRRSSVGASRSRAQRKIERSFFPWA
jgi:hypothetical protein